METPEPADLQDEPTPSDGDLAADETDLRPPRSGAVTRFAVNILKEPDVVLTDPPAILGGASHTW